MISVRYQIMVEFLVPPGTDLSGAFIHIAADLSVPENRLIATTRELIDFELLDPNPHQEWAESLRRPTITDSREGKCLSFALLGANRAQSVSFAFLADGGRWFETEPEPFGVYRFHVKNETREKIQEIVDHVHVYYPVSDEEIQLLIKTEEEE